jgi:hypothetical protein
MAHQNEPSKKIFDFMADEIAAEAKRLCNANINISKTCILDHRHLLYKFL